MYEYTAETVRVVDGDTLDVRLDLGLDVRIDVTLRLVGLNAPEMRTPEGKACKAWVEHWITIRQSLAPVIVCTVKDHTEKYGRYLAEVLCGGVSLNEELLTNGLAVPYNPRSASPVTRRTTSCTGTTTRT
jgi:micrococcal nuclease